MSQPTAEAQQRTGCTAENEQGMLHEELFIVFSQFARRAQQSLILAAPFVTQKALEVVMQGVTARSVMVITTWKTADVLRGASDTSIYPFLRSHGWSLRLYPKLHAKLVIADLRSAIVSTANVTEAGLGLVRPHNVECAVTIETLLSADQLWILNLAFQSVPITDAYYSAFKNHIASIPEIAASPIPEFDPAALHLHNNIGPIALPLSDSPGWLIPRLEALRNVGICSLDQETLRKVLHDVTLFSLQVSARPEVNIRILREKFFALPAVRKLQPFLRTGRYFGEIKAWLRSHWIDGPPPSRQQLTRVVRVLLAWFVELSEGQYVVTRPHYSQCLAPSRNGATAPFLS